jgi:general secretion pathway protein N
MMRRLLIWTLAGIASVTFTALAFFPAAWLASIVETQSAGRLTLGDAQGTLWRGSAYIGAAAGSNDPVTPLLPGRFAWRVSPAVLLGRVDAELDNPEALTNPVSVTGNWRQWQVSPAAVTLPAERLAALGAPLNTIQPSGRMRLSWQLLQLTRQKGNIEVAGLMNLEMNDIASRLSPVKPLGSYDLAFEWHKLKADVNLKTIKGPLLLNGSGNFSNGRLQFSGKAEAEAGQEEQLANLLNLLGQRRMLDGRNVIALEFK